LLSNNVVELATARRTRVAFRKYLKNQNAPDLLLAHFFVMQNMRNGLLYKPAFSSFFTISILRAKLINF